MKPGEMLCVVYRITGRGRVWHIHLPLSGRKICPAYLNMVHNMEEEENASDD